MRLICLSIITILVFITSSFSDVYSQVTIGSEYKPNDGALLDLKQNSDGTSFMGLNLPRVKLVDLTTSGNDLRVTIEGNETTGEGWDKMSHIGLLIYNVNNDPRICVGEHYLIPPTKGTYVWTGSEWKPLFKQEDKYPDVRSYIDNGAITVGGITVGSFTMSYDDGVNPAENETYYYADYGEAGIWMTQSLRTRYTPQGELIAMTGNQTSNGLDNTGKPQKVAAYPARSGSAASATDYNTNRSAGKEIGLLYDWYTMTNHENCIVVNQAQVGYLSANPATPDVNEVESREERGFVQGICPKGWYLPTDRDWNRLEKYLTQNASALTQETVTSNGIWTNSWENTTQWRGNITGRVMKSKNTVSNSSYTLNNANSKTSLNGGFDAFMTGYAAEGTVGDYGYHGYFWTSSSYNSSIAWARGLRYDISEVFRGDEGSKNIFLQVRCVKK